ncbi:MAG: hypothetical protein ACRD21_02645 [Vicinamibacteria bacterium]
MGRRSRDAAVLALCLALGSFSCSSMEADPPFSEFVVEVDSESFVARIADPGTIVHFREAIAGSRAGFPAGPLRSGDGGFNSPWTWHLDPEETRLVEAAIEVCDGRPSYVESHQNDFPTYCPWGARIVAER